MRKQVGSEVEKGEGEGEWLDLDALARVEVSSEGPGFPVENALVPGSPGPWQAASPGPAKITLRFDAPQRIGRMRFRFEDAQHERSQEWALRATLAGSAETELLRQGWNFSPGGSVAQDETYTLGLSGVTSLTLEMDPDRGRNRYPATLAAWRISAG